MNIEVRLVDLAPLLGITVEQLKTYKKLRQVRWGTLAAGYGVTIPLNEFIKLVVFIKCKRILQPSFIDKYILSEDLKNE